jgi:hypothetical protein
VTNSKKKSKIPSDFEPVSRRKQDEEKDILFNQMGDKQNAKFAAQRFDDDEADSDDAYHETDSEAPEEVLQEDTQSDID